MDGIDLDFCDNCRIWNNLIQSIQGQFAIRVTNSQDTRIYDNKIFNYNFQAIGGLTTAVAGPGNVNLWITRNTVDTCTAPAGAGGSCYGISCSGFTTFPLPGPLTQHCFVEENVVRNIPHWECYDSHGGRDQWFVDNWGENCRFGIQVGAANDFSTTNGVLDGVHIKGNHLNRGSGDPDGYGIVLSGDDVSSKVTNADVLNNEVSGYGATPTATDATIGAITASHADKVLIQGNKIPAYYQNAINFFGDVSNVRILDNIAGDMLNFKTLATSGFFAVSQNGAWNVFIDGNTLQPTATANAAQKMVSNGFKASNIKLGPNNKASMLRAGGSAFDTAGSFVEYGFPSNYLQQTTVLGPLNYMNGDIGYDNNNRPAYVFLGPTQGGSSPDANQGFWSFDTSTVVAVGSINSGSNSLTLGSSAVCGGASMNNCFPIGMNITVANAGPSAGPLNAKVVGAACSNSGGGGSSGCNAAPPAFTYTLILDTAAGATANNTNITWRNGSQPVPIAPGTDFFQQLLACGSAQGCEWPSGSLSGIGFIFSNDSPFLVMNAKQDQFNADHWTQINSTFYSMLLRMSVGPTTAASTVQVFSAPPGQAAGIFGSFWTQQFQINAAGSGNWVNAQFTGLSSAGKALCSRADKSVGTCTSQPDAAGTCNCP